MFIAIDTFILERIYTPFAWWFERRTGRTNFYLAWWAFGLANVCLVVYLGLKIIETHQIRWVDVLFGVSFLLVTAIGMRYAQKEDARVHRNPDRMTVSAQISDVIARVVWMSFSLLFLTAFVLEPTMIDLFGALFFSFLMSGLYFSSVRRPPAKPRKEESRELKFVPNEA